MFRMSRQLNFFKPISKPSSSSSDSSSSSSSSLSSPSPAQNMVLSAYKAFNQEVSDKCESISNVLRDKGEREHEPNKPMWAVGQDHSLLRLKYYVRMEDKFKMKCQYPGCSHSVSGKTSSGELTRHMNSHPKMVKLFSQQETWEQTAAPSRQQNRPQDRFNEAAALSFAVNHDAHVKVFFFLIFLFLDFTTVFKPG